MEAKPDHLGHRPTWAEIDLNALAANFHFIRARIDSDVKVMCVVKADAYGHGGVCCARRLAEEGADWFAVALPEEGAVLREAGITQPILCLGGFWPGQEELCLLDQLVPVVYRLDSVASLDRAAKVAGRVAPVHVKIDTGMGRLGVRYDAAEEFARSLLSFKNIRVDGLMTHFAAADEPARDAFTHEQLRRFRRAAEAFREQGHRPTYEDMANSAATYAHPESWSSMVRPGGMLYGLWQDTLPPSTETPALRSVMSLRTRITLLKRIGKGETLGYGCTFEAKRETLVATLPIGYNDGYRRALSNAGRVIVRGRYAPVVGRISMDLTMVDVTDIDGVAQDDCVTLLGEDEGLEITAAEVARTIGTLSYEMTCGISQRVPRYYKDRSGFQTDATR